MENPKDKIYSVLKEIASEMVDLEVEFKVERPKDATHGDFSSNIGLTLFAKIKNQKSRQRRDSPKGAKIKNPLEAAEEIVKILNSKFLIQSSDFDKIEAVEPGFINFYLSKDYLLLQLGKVLEQKERFGSKNEDPNKKVVVEYSSPNIAKPFTIGHLRSTIIGDAIANLLEATGWKVYRDNHLGDWGTQFGKQIYAIKTWGNEEEIDKSENPVKDLVALYVKFHEEAEKDPELEDKAREWFKKLEDGDPEARRLWKKCVDWSWKEFEVVYEKLGVRFTENKGLGYGEAFFEDKMEDVLKDLDGNKLLKESEGAKLVFFPDEKLSPLMIIKKDGATLYATRDLTTDKFRLKEYGKDIVVINEVGIEQTLYFKQLFEVEKMLGWFKDGQRIHKRHGHYRFKDVKMSTRKGNTIWLKDVLKEAEEKAWNLQKHQSDFESNGEQVITKSLKSGKAAQQNVLGAGQRLNVAEIVGIGAIKWNDLKRASEQDIVFDWDDVLNMQGDSGPYIQYAFVRTQSVLEKSGKKTKFENVKDLNSEELSLLRTISQFGEIIQNSAETFSPNILCNYLFDLAQQFNLFYQKNKIIGSEYENFRLALTAGIGQVIKNGLNLLGISAPESM
jgi:arginyl-tRNA synthetase